MSKSAGKSKKTKSSPCNKLRIATGTFMLESKAFSSFCALKYHVLCNDFEITHNRDNVGLVVEHWVRV